MSILEHRTFVTLEARRDAAIDIGEYRARMIKADAERKGLKLGEGVVRWRRIGDLRAQAEAKGEQPLEPSYLRDNDWLLEVMIPIVDGELESRIKFAKS
jgi:hypothetical protein